MVGHVDDEARFKKLLQRPYIAWPTVTLAVAGVLVYVMAIAAQHYGLIPVWLAVVCTSVAAFWFFTVFHDASHNSLSQNKSINDWLGRFAVIFLIMFPFYGANRFIHMQHHRFTNEADGLDPDTWAVGGPRWQIPLRWLVHDLRYYAFYLPKMSQRPRAELVEFIWAIVFFLLTVGGLVFAGFAWEVLLFWFLPGRIAIVMLVLAFSVLPHLPHDVTQKENKYRATNLRVGFEWLLSPLLLNQNYHLVHHLYPTVPFYRYLAVWRAKEQFHQAQNPLLLSAFSNQEIVSN
jgi:beta-carotene hydroxylase